MSVILTRGKGGSPLTELHATVGPSATVNVDTVPIGMYRSSKWLITVTDETLDLATSYEVLAMHTQLTNPTHNKYGIIGDIVLHSLDVVLIGTDLILQVTNPQAHNILVDAVRIPTSS